MANIMITLLHPLNTKIEMIGYEYRYLYVCHKLFHRLSSSSQRGKRFKYIDKSTFHVFGFLFLKTLAFRDETFGEYRGCSTLPIIKKGDLSSNSFGSLYKSRAILKNFIYVALSLLLFAPAKYYVVYRK